MLWQVLTVLNDSPKYLPGYWRGEATVCRQGLLRGTWGTHNAHELLPEATACAVDGYVCESLLKQPVRQRLKDSVRALSAAHRALFDDDRDYGGVPC